MDVSRGERILRGSRDDSWSVLSAFESTDGTRLLGTTEREGHRVYALNVWDAQTGAELSSWPVQASADLARAITGYGRNAPPCGTSREARSRIEGIPKAERSAGVRRDFGTLATPSSAQRYFSSDSAGACYSRELHAASAVLTDIVDGARCSRSTRAIDATE